MPPHCDVICLEMKNTNMLMRGARHPYSWIRLVRRLPWLVLTLMDQQPMAQVAHRMRRTRAITLQNWPYTLEAASFNDASVFPVLWAQFDVASP